MPSFHVSIDTTQFVANTRALEQKQLPYIMAKTLTNVVQDGQVEVRRNVERAFKLRNTWTERGIRIKPADKRGNAALRTIEADVHTDTANRSTGAPDYMGRQEDGGERVPLRGREHIAIPTRYLRRYAPGAIPQALRPKGLLPPDAEIGKVYKGSFTGGGKRWETVSKRGVRTLGSTGFVAFLQYDRRGTLCVFVRSASRRDAEPFYVLITEAHIRKSALEMFVTVKRTAEDRFPRHWDNNWRQLYASGLRI